MSHRADLTRIDSARREATRQRLPSTGMLPKRVDELLAAFEALPEARPFNGEAAYRRVLDRRR